MALLFVDGFDHYATADITKKWTSSTTGTIGGPGRRSTAGCLALVTTGSTVTKSFTAAQTLTAGVAVQISAFPSAINAMLGFQDAGSTQVKVSVDTDGTLRVYRGTGTTNLLGSSAAPGIAALNTWYYIEFKTKIDPSVGTIEVKVNGTSVITLTSQNTRATANSTANTLALFGLPPGSTFFDDLYLCDSAGSTNNTFLGDVRVDCLTPNGDGNYTSFTPSTGTSHFALVDEATPNTTDYNESSTATNKDSYQMVNLGALTSQTIYGIQVSGAVLKDDAGVRSIKVGVRSSSTDSVSAAQSLSTSQLYYTNIHETDPATSAAWTESGVNAAEALFEVA